jgi:hypothetical protein
MSAGLIQANVRIPYNLPDVTLDTPKSTLFIVVGTLGVAAVLAIFGIAMFTQASSSTDLIEDDEDNATTTQRLIVDVVVMQCSANGEGQQNTVPIVVSAYSNSTYAPFYPNGTSCAQAISDLMTNEFSLWTERRGDASDIGTYYTLLRHRYLD